jgi:hypothetical protein
MLSLLWFLQNLPYTPATNHAAWQLKPHCLFAVTVLRSRSSFLSSARMRITRSPLNLLLMSRRRRVTTAVGVADRSAIMAVVLVYWESKSRLNSRQ